MALKKKVRYEGRGAGSSKFNVEQLIKHGTRPPTIATFWACHVTTRFNIYFASTLLKCLDEFFYIAFPKVVKYYYLFVFLFPIPYFPQT